MAEKLCCCRENLPGELCSRVVWISPGKRVTLSLLGAGLEGRCVLGPGRSSWCLSPTLLFSEPDSFWKGSCPRPRAGWCGVKWAAAWARGACWGGDGAAGAGMGTQRWRTGMPGQRAGPALRALGGTVTQTVDQCGQDAPPGPVPGWPGCHTWATTRVRWGQFLELGERRSLPRAVATPWPPRPAGGAGQCPRHRPPPRGCGAEWGGGPLESKLQTLWGSQSQAPHRGDVFHLHTSGPHSGHLSPIHRYPRRVYSHIDPIASQGLDGASFSFF